MVKKVSPPPVVTPEPPAGKPIHRFKKGDPRPEGAGRKPGQPNRITRDIKEALLRTLDALGNEAFFIKMGQSRDGNNQRAIATLLGKLLPTQTQLSGPNGGPIQTEAMTRQLSTLPREDLAHLVAILKKIVPPSGGADAG